ncbi:MAG: grdB [Deltaproteobacteria bacterium]|nr:grdB [Deltaproteobacteria bacterium]
MGIPAVQLSAVIAVAEMVGSNRIMLAQKIVNPVGNADLDPVEEKKLRRSMVKKALTALQADVEKQTVLR